MSAPDEHLERQEPPTWAILLAFAVIYFCWGTTYYATSVAMKQEKLPPALFGGLRLLAAGVLLLFYQLLRGQSLRLTLGEAARLVVVSWFLFLCANLLINIGQKQVESGVSAILIATIPLWMGLFGMLYPQGERLSRRGWFGLLLGFFGIVVTMAPQVSDGFQLLDMYPMLILASAASWAAGSLVSRHMAIQLPHLTSAGFQMLFGGLSQVALATAIGEWYELPPQLSNRAIGTFLYLLVAGSLGGFVAFNWLLGHIPAANVGTYAYVNPVIAVFIGWLFNETQVYLSLGMGVAVILVGVYLVRSDHRPSQEIEIEPD